MNKKQKIDCLKKVFSTREEYEVLTLVEYTRMKATLRKYAKKLKRIRKEANA